LTGKLRCKFARAFSAGFFAALPFGGALRHPHGCFSPCLVDNFQCAFVADQARIVNGS
jgi:hypothetical protein